MQVGLSGGSSRPPLNMRQPIVTPRSYGGGRYGGADVRAPGYGGGHSAPSSHGGGFSHGGDGGVDLVRRSAAAVDRTAAEGTGAADMGGNICAGLFPGVTTQHSNTLPQQ